MRKIKGNQSGITLIALVITIIVLLILAGIAISMLSGENGIPKQAEKAKTAIEQEETVEGMKLAGLAALSEVKGNVENEQYIEILNIEIKKIDNNAKEVEELPEENIEVNGEFFAIKENGEVVHLAKWHRVDNTDKITNGNYTLKLGDIVKYDPTEGLTKDEDGIYKKYKSLQTKNGSEDITFNLSDNDEGRQKLTWVVLGINENGEILIVSTKNIKTSLGDTQIFNLEGQQAAIYGAEEVNKIAEIYGYGKGAKSARALQIEDLDRISGYKKETYAKGNINEYRNKVTYSWTDTKNQISVVGLNGKETIETNANYATNGFIWYDELTKKWVKSKQEDYSTFPAKIVTLTSTFYGYNISKDDFKPETLYNAIVANNADNRYWLGTGFTRARQNNASYGVCLFQECGVYGGNLYMTDGNKNNLGFGVRPVVALNSSITLSPDGENVWKIK